jgi:cytochrome P450
MVFIETLRKWPVAHIQFRRASQEFKIPNSNLTIPENTFIIIPVFGIHRDERFYENPDKFEPERFSDENKNKIKQMAYIPFSEGPRACIGERIY